MNELTIARQAIAHRGKRLEYFTIVWNFLEGLVAIAAGAVSGSISLVGFGIVSSRLRLVPHCCGECRSTLTLRGEKEMKK